MTRRRPPQPPETTRRLEEFLDWLENDPAIQQCLDRLRKPIAVGTTMDLIRREIAHCRAQIQPILAGLAKETWPDELVAAVRVLPHVDNHLAALTAYVEGAEDRSEVARWTRDPRPLGTLTVKGAAQAIDELDADSLIDAGRRQLRWETDQGERHRIGRIMIEIIGLWAAGKRGPLPRHQARPPLSDDEQQRHLMVKEDVQAIIHQLKSQHSTRWADLPRAETRPAELAWALIGRRLGAGGGTIQEKIDVAHVKRLRKQQNLARGIM